MKAVSLLESLKQGIINSDSYLSSLDDSLETFLIENEYAVTQAKNFETLLEFEFGQDSEVVFEWLYNAHNTEIYNMTASELVESLSQKWKTLNEQCGG